MKSNPYADLRIDNRADLPAPWYDYPVLQSGEYRTEILYTSGRDYVKVHIGQQDGAWVAATTWMIGGRSMVNPNRSSEANRHCSKYN